MVYNEIGAWMKKTKFYSFNQNNSGGGWQVNKSRGIGEYVIIEADSQDEAKSKAEDLGLYFDGVQSGQDCDCCGDRWHDYPEITNEPKIYGKKIDEKKWTSMWNIPSYIHYKDGTKKELVPLKK